MIEKLVIYNFKGFKTFSIDFQRLNLLVGGNNCGKTTLFHALQLYFWCVDQTADIAAGEVTFRKTQVAEIGVVPCFASRDLFHLQKTRSGRQPQKIKLELVATDVTPISFEIYPAFSRNLMVDGGMQTISSAEFALLKQLKPVFVPGTIGITVKEEYLRIISQERLISEGRQNQVLRNLIYRLSQSGEWQDFVKTVLPLFQLANIEVPFDLNDDEWLTAVYKQDDCQFDFVSAGSGFLQVMNLLCFLYLNESKVALLDEPDSHMHDDLQRLTFELLDRLSTTRRIQLIIASHSPMLIDSAGLENILLIDRAFNLPLKANNVDSLIPMLGDRGLSLPPAKVMNTLKSRCCLFVEGAEADYQDFVERIGEILIPGFKSRTRGMTVFETGGATKKWPFDAIEGFRQLIGVQIKYVYLSDRDFLTDLEIVDREQKASDQGRKIIHLSLRNRESYLLNPKVMSRVLRKKWSEKNSGVEVPDQLCEGSIKNRILKYAREVEDECRTALTLEHEQALRSDRAGEMKKLNEYFRVAYLGPLENDRVPYKLLDAKSCLRHLRTEIADQCKISFSDREILDAFLSNEVPADLKAVINEIVQMFPNVDAAQTSETAKLEEEVSLPLFRDLEGTD